MSWEHLPEGGDRAETRTSGARDAIWLEYSEWRVERRLLKWRRAVANVLLLERLAAVDVLLLERNRRWRCFAAVVEPLCEGCYLRNLRDGAPGPHSWGCPAFAGPGPVAKSTGVSIAVRRAAARAMMLATSPTLTPKSTSLDVGPGECSEDTDGPLPVALR